MCGGWEKGFVECESKKKKKKHATTQNFQKYYVIMRQLMVAMDFGNGILLNVNQ